MARKSLRTKTDPLWDITAGFDEDSDEIAPIPLTSHGVTDVSPTLQCVYEESDDNSDVRSNKRKSVVSRRKTTNNNKG